MSPPPNDPTINKTTTRSWDPPEAATAKAKAATAAKPRKSPNKTTSRSSRAGAATPLDGSGVNKTTSRSYDPPETAAPAAGLPGEALGTNKTTSRSYDPAPKSTPKKSKSK